MVGPEGRGTTRNGGEIRGRVAGHGLWPVAKREKQRVAEQMRAQNQALGRRNGASWWGGRQPGLAGASDEVGNRHGHLINLQRQRWAVGGRGRSVS